MSDTQPSNDMLCLAALRDNDRDRYLASLLTPVESRSALSALYAYNAELARVRDVTREPLTGEVRLQYWRDLLAGSAHGETAANPIAAELLNTVRTHSLPVAALVGMADARIFDLYDDPMESTAMFEGYAGETASALIQLSSLVLDPAAAEGASDIAGHAGVAQLVAGSLLMLPIHSRRGQVYLPADILAAAGLDRAGFLAGEDQARIATALDAFIGYGLDHLEKARAGGTIPKQLLPAYLPAALTENVLKRARRAGADVLVRDIRAPQWRRQLSLLATLISGRI